ncbi:MAG: hypothetical protein ACREFC_01170 [Stellaceae bacterium]
MRLALLAALLMSIAAGPALAGMCGGAGGGGMGAAGGGMGMGNGYYMPPSQWQSAPAQGNTTDNPPLQQSTAPPDPGNSRTAPDPDR